VPQFRQPVKGIKTRQKRKVIEKNIVLKEESLYKPLMTTFFVFLFLFTILFNNSIFDSIFPEFMNFFRRLMIPFFGSLGTTLFALPTADAYFIGMLFGSGSDILNIIIFTTSLVVFDTF